MVCSNSNSYLVEFTGWKKKVKMMNNFVKIKIYGVTEDDESILISQTDLTQNGGLKEVKSSGWMDDLVEIFDGETCVQSSDLVAKCVAFWGRSAPVVYKRLKNLDLVKTRDGNTMWYSLGESSEDIDSVPDFVEESKWNKKQLRELEAYNLTYGKSLTEEDADGLRVLEGEWNQIGELEDDSEGPLDFGGSDMDVDDAVNDLLSGDYDE